MVVAALFLQSCSTSAPAGDGSERALFPTPESDFNYYIGDVRKVVTSHSLPGRSAADTELNLPFEVRANPHIKYRGRFLLFHGLNDSTYVWHDLAADIAERGFDVRAVLFEGHGSSPRDMLGVSYQTWMRSARKHLQLLSDDDTPVYIGGFSMGAVVACLLALENPHVAGLFLVSPAYHSKLNNYLRWSGMYARFRPWVFGGMIGEDNPIKYNSIPVNSGWQFYKLTQVLKRKWGQSTLHMPVLMVATENDSVIDIDYVRRVFRRRFTHARRHLLTYRAKPQDNLPTHEESRSSQFLQRRIINQSHLGLMYSSSNPLFGEEAGVLVCNGNEYPVFMACMRAHGHWFGAQHTPSPDTTPVARTTYNPDYGTILQRFDQVFNDS